MKRLLVIPFAFGFALFFATSAEARTRTPWILPSGVVEAGYTIATPDKEFLVGVLPGVLNGASYARLDTFDETDDEYPDPPNGWRIATPYAGVYLANADPFPAVHPNVALRYDDEADGTAVRAAYYGQSDDTWHFIPSSPALEQRYVRASVPFSQVRLAGLVPDRPAGPVRISEESQPGFDARAFLVMDAASGAVLFDHNIHEVLPLASLTKLATAETAIGSGLDLNAETIYASGDEAEGATVSFEAGDVLSNRDVLGATLVRSGNNAARLLARSTGIEANAFAANMTQRTRDLGLSTPTFVEPTGLHSSNRSSAYDFAVFADHAFAQTDIMTASTRPSYALSVRNTGRDISFPNTNWWLDDNDFVVTGSKTGYLPASWGGIGFNLVVRARSSADSGNDLVIVSLGAPTRMRSIQDVDAFLRWAFLTHSWN